MIICLSVIIIATLLSFGIFASFSLIGLLILALHILALAIELVPNKNKMKIV